MLSLVIKGGTVFDGTGAPGQRADVGITHDRIAIVGDLSAVDPASVPTVPAAGLYVSPGFIDIHTHSDITALSLPGQHSAVSQGITTQVTGNCGLCVGMAGPGSDFALERRGLRPDGVPAHDWSSLAEHLRLIEQQGIATNYLTQAGHNTVRRRVMGPSHHAPSLAELDAMRALVREGMEHGAVALTTGLEYVPGRYARLPEIVALAREAAALDGYYASHLRSEGDHLVEAVREALEVGRRAGIAVQLSHHKAEGRENWGAVERTLEMVEQARREGVDVALDQYPYLAYMTGLSVAVLPSWAYDGGPEAMARRLCDPEMRARIRDEVLHHHPTWRDIGPESGWHQMVIARAPGRPELQGLTVAQIAAQQSADPLELVLELLCAPQPPFISVIHFAMSEDDVRTVLRHPLTMVASDLVAVSPDSADPTHPRCYGTFPRVLGEYVRRQGVLTWEDAIRKMTGLPARRLGLARRGLIRPGHAADLVVFDPTAVDDRATFEQPHRYAVGIVHVLVNGRFALRDGALTGALAGRVLRRGDCEVGPGGV